MHSSAGDNFLDARLPAYPLLSRRSDGELATDELRKTVFSGPHAPVLAGDYQQRARSSIRSRGKLSSSSPARALTWPPDH